MHKWGIFLIICFVLFSCRKNKPALSEINGEIRNLHNQQTIAGINIYLEAQEIQNGNFNTSWRLVQQTTSNAQGQYQLVFDKKNVIAYRIRLEKENYFSKEVSINPDNVKTDETMTIDVDLAGMSWLKMDILNTSPVNNQDQFSYNISAGHLNCDDPCCNANQHTFLGMDVDTNVVCLAESDHLIYLSGISIKNGQGTPFDANGFLTLGDTLIINAHY